MTIIDSKVKVAISSDFLSAFARIPKSQQSKVLEFVEKFRVNPCLPGINYEKIHQAKYSGIHSVRIDNCYRGIVLKPQNGNVFILLWVDHHDKAYDWAKNKQVCIHPETGSLQIFDVEQSVVPDSESERDTKEEIAGLFAQYRDRNLTRLGVPESQIPLVRKIRTNDELDEISNQLPQEAYESLSYLAAGFSFEEVLAETEKNEHSETFDTGDYEKALENPDSMRRFFVVDNELELAAMLNAPLEKWRTFLHPSQRKLVEKSFNGPVKVLGGAGTGKTVVAMHRAKWLAEKIYTGINDRILFTTFSRNLAADIRQNLRQICPESVLRRIEVVNLDRWVVDFLQRNGYKYKIDYGTRTEELWKKALSLAPVELGFDNSFYREEWEKIIQSQGITSLNEYLKASRIGRKVKVSRDDRRKVWEVFQEYRTLMDENGVKEIDDAIRDARIILTSKGDILPYKSIIVDESQDMGNQAFQLLRAIVPGGEQPNDLFIVGDAHQRIYRHKVVLSKCGINIRGRSKKLKINYRTTEEIRKWAVKLLNGITVDDLDGGIDELKGYKSLLHGSEPRIIKLKSFEEEIKWISGFINSKQNENVDLKSICVVVRTNDLLHKLESALLNSEIPIYSIKRSEPEDRSIQGIRLSTMHRIKGLEFDTVIIAGTKFNNVETGNSEHRTDQMFENRFGHNNENNLLYVAATRAKKEIVVTSVE